MTKTLQEASKFAIRVALQLAVLYNKHCHKCKLWAVSFWAPSPFNKEVFLLTLKTCATPFFSACESSAALPKQQWTEDTIVHWTKTSKCTWHQTSPSSRCPKSKSDHSFAMLQCSATNAVRSCRARVCCRELLLDVVRWMYFADMQAITCRLKWSDARDSILQAKDCGGDIVWTALSRHTLTLQQSAPAAAAAAARIPPKRYSKQAILQVRGQAFVFSAVCLNTLVGVGGRQRIHACATSVSPMLCWLAKPCQGGTWLPCSARKVRVFHGAGPDFRSLEKTQKRQGKLFLSLWVLCCAPKATVNRGRRTGIIAAGRSCILQDHAFCNSCW